MDFFCEDSRNQCIGEVGGGSHKETSNVEYIPCWKTGEGQCNGGSRDRKRRIEEIQREDQLSTQKLAANHAEHIRHMERERMGIEREVNSQKTAITHAFINSHGNVA